MENESQNLPAKIDWSVVSENVGNISNCLTSLATLKQSVTLAELDLQKMDRQLEMASMLILQHENDTDAKLEQVEKIHNDLNKVVDACIAISTQEDISEVKLKIVLSMLDFANKCLDKLPNL